MSTSNWPEARAFFLSARKEIQLGRNEYWVATIAVSPLYINSMPRAAAGGRICGLQPRVHANGLLGGAPIHLGEYVGVQAAGDEVAALVSKTVPGGQRRRAAGPLGLEGLLHTCPGGVVVRAERGVGGREESAHQHAVEQHDGQYRHDGGTDEQRHLLTQAQTADQEPGQQPHQVAQYPGYRNEQRSNGYGDEKRL
ncbi:Uncharacterised protein [Mycobacteroides abscessus subsp. massiliense]|nr:Uncharacterised protein [Mycobacteroides abscessus subsp. massiliense]